MQDLGKYKKKTHVAIQNRYVSLLAVGSIALVALVFTLGVLVGRRSVDEQRCPELDPLQALDLKAEEPAPPKADTPVRLSFHDSLAHPKDTVPTPASLLAEGSATDPEIINAGAPLKTPRMSEPPIPEKVAHDEPGVYSLQVGSFDDRTEATRMSQKLERAGHQTFLVSVNMPDRGGVWYRVRIGPFSSKKDAWTYKKSFEDKERLPAFVVKRRIAG